jgi:putative phage-type endonuclease
MQQQVGSLLQGSDEWHAHRAKHNNASEAGAVMCCNPWQPKNPSELYDLKKGTLEIKYNTAMRHGNDTEPLARAWAEVFYKEDFTPAVYTNGRYSASLDGVNFDGSMGIEIKCPQNSESKLFDVTTRSELKAQAPHYYWQIVHQFYVLQSMKHLAFVVYHADKQLSLLIHRDDVTADFKALTDAWDAFTQALDSNQRPVDDDVDDSDEFQKLVHAYRIEKLKVEAAEASLKVVEEELKDYAKRSGRAALKGFGATVTQVTRQGSVDYAKVPELKGLDLERYRKKPSTYWMVKV